MKFKKLNGRKLKKDIYDRCGKKPTSCKRVWHNKHTDGTGNFGYYIDFGKGKPSYKIYGEYNKEKKIEELKIRDYGEMRSSEEIKPPTYEKLLGEICKRVD